MAATPTAPPPGRYGDAPRPGADRRRAVVLTLLGVLAVALVVWLSLGQTRTAVTWTDVGFSIRGSEVDVVYDISRPDPGVPVRCRLQALSHQHAQVGVVEVDVPPSPERAVRRTDTVVTSEPAVTGVVDTCWAPGEQG